jgi:predicted nucleic acid-binding protein
LPRNILLLDACIAINLAATNQLPEIAKTLDLTFSVTEQVATEVGYLRDVVNGELVTTAIDLGIHTRRGILEVIKLHPSEYELYIELAGVVDDGEASTIAVAIERGLQLATDDRKARSLWAERHLLEPLRTLDLLHDYTDAARYDSRDVHRLLIRVRDRASFQPARSDPHHKWWNDHITPPPT